MVHFLFFLSHFFCTHLLASNCLQRHYKYINSAELAICDQKLQQAQQLYTAAFALECNPAHRVDLYNAFITSCQLNNWSKAKKYALSMRQQGIDYEYIAKKINHYFKGKDRFLQALKKTLMYSSWKHQQLVLSTLNLFDNIPRQDCIGYPEHCRNLIKYNDSIILITFQKFIQQEGGWVAPVSADNLPFSLPYYYFFITHNTRWDRFWLQKEMKQALHTGKIAPYLYGSIMEELSKNKSFDSPLHYGLKIWQTINYKNYIKTIPTEQIAAINQNRAAIYLCSLEEQEKKLRYHIGQTEFNLCPLGTVYIETSEQYLIERLENGTIQSY